MRASNNRRNQTRFRVVLILTLVGLIIAVTLLGAARLISAQANAASWSFTGNLNTARHSHTATLLPNGNVLVAGGSNYNAGGGVVNSTELYDPSTGLWSSTGSLNTSRYAHTATLLHNGKVLVVGGYDGRPPNILNSAELYDPATGNWSITGSLNTPRAGSHTATLLPNGKVLVIGGIFDSSLALTNSAELYDPAIGTWSHTGNVSAGNHTATLLQNGKVLVTGVLSCSPEGDLCDYYAELYHPATGTWSSTGAPATFGVLTTLLPNGRVLATGSPNPIGVSISAELYDPATGTWSSTGAPTIFGPQTLLPSGKVLVVEGDAGGNGAELYDADTGTWSTTAILKTARQGPTATLLSNGRVLVAAGNIFRGPGTLNSAELYDPGTDSTPTPTPTPSPTPTPTVTPTPTPTPTPAGPTWTIAGNLNTGRDYHTATLLPNGKVLVIGGNDSNGTLKGAELYEPASGTWSMTGSLNTSRAFHTATLLPSGKVLVAGGFTCAPPRATCSHLDSAELYDPATGVWSSTANLNVAHASHTATLLPNGKVLVAGDSSCELYDPVTGAWSITGNLNWTRYGPTMTLLPSGKVLVTGGDVEVPNAELYDPATGAWSITGAFNTWRLAHTATLLPSGKVLVTGGDFRFDGTSAELYDPATGMWSSTGGLATGRQYHTATLLAGGKVLVAAGFNTTGGSPNILNSAELYDPATGTWSNTATLNIGRRFHTATLLPNGKVLAAGGNGFNAPNSAELYDPGASPPNPIDDAQSFVRQHYLDFLDREPDAGGLAYWTGRITHCGSDAGCIHERRISVSAAFFIELEFQDTGYFVYRFYKSSFGRQPNFTEFSSDRTKVSGGSNLEAKKQAFADEWVQRATFLAAYPITMSNPEVVNKLFDAAGLTSSIYDPQRQQEILAMNAGRSRALVLRDVIEIPDFKNIPDPHDPRYVEIKQTSQYNPAFVLMQYFGYLHRDLDQNGYAFWLDVVNNREPNNYHGMVCSFITSTEYQLRFGSVVTRSNADCRQ